MTKPLSQYSIQSSPSNVSLPGSQGLTAVNETSTNDDPIAPLKLSLSQLTTLRWSLGEEAVQLKQTGYDAIGIWRPKLAEHGEVVTSEVLRRAKLSVSSLSFAGGFTGGCGHSYIEAIADCRHAISQAKILGARNVIVVGGSQNGHTANHSRRLVVESLRSLADNAAEAEVQLSLLPMHKYFTRKWTFLNSLDHALEIIDLIGRSTVDLAFDIYHLWQEERLIDRISEIARLTGIVQLSDCDHVPRSDRDRMMPGEGSLPLTKIVQAFQAAGYSGYFDLQVWSDTVWKSSYLHQIEQGHAAMKAMSLRTAIST